MAHEFLQACQVLGGHLRDFQKFAFDTWSQEYRGDLGIALRHVFTRFELPARPGSASDAV